MKISPMSLEARAIVRERTPDSGSPVTTAGTLRAMTRRAVIVALALGVALALIVTTARPGEAVEPTRASVVAPAAADINTEVMTAGVPLGGVAATVKAAGAAPLAAAPFFAVVPLVAYALAMLYTVSTRLLTSWALRAGWFSIPGWARQQACQTARARGLWIGHTWICA